MCFRPPDNCAAMTRDKMPVTHLTPLSWSKFPCSFCLYGHVFTDTRETDLSLGSCIALGDTLKMICALIGVFLVLRVGKLDQTFKRWIQNYVLRHMSSVCQVQAVPVQHTGWLPLTFLVKCRLNMHFNFQLLKINSSFRW